MPGAFRAPRVPVPPVAHVAESPARLVDLHRCLEPFEILEFPFLLLLTLPSRPRALQRHSWVRDGRARATAGAARHLECSELLNQFALLLRLTLIPRLLNRLE